MSIGFRCQSYVCILRWKGGEKAALKELYAHDRLRITPLLELPDPNSAGDPPPNGKGKTMCEIAEEVQECWGHGFAFFDLRVLDAPPLPGVVHPVEKFFTTAAERGLRLVPVTSLGRSLSYQQVIRSVVAADQRGVCVRLSRGDLAIASLEKVIDAHLMRLGVRPQDADLVVDLEIVDEPGYDLEEICARLPYLMEWRTLVVAGGAFPKDLQDMGEGSNLLPRWEWRAWKNQIRQELPRVPIYGDYTTLHPFLSERVPGINPSASIRYTTDDDWLVMRGRGVLTEGSGGYTQFPANAQLLCARKEYRGPSFSPGDRFLHDIATGKSLPGRRKKRKGSLAQWVQAGVSQHLALVPVQLASLFDSSTGDAR